VKDMMLTIKIPNCGWSSDITNLSECRKRE